MYAERHVVPLSTDGAGAATGYTPVVTGRIRTIVYVPDGTSPYDNTVDVTITLEATAESVLSKSNVAAAFVAAPRQATHAVDGSASLYAAAGEPAEDYIVAASDRVKIVLAQGGATKSGVFHIVVG